LPEHREQCQEHAPEEMQLQIKSQIE